MELVVFHENSESQVSTSITNNSENEDMEIESVIIPDDTENVVGSLLHRKAKTIEELYNMYKQHANALGFTTKLSTLRTSKKFGKPLERYFRCSCEGKYKPRVSAAINTSPVDVGHTFIPSLFQRLDAEPKKYRKQRKCVVKITCCNAMMRVKLLSKEDLYIVARHDLEHNHEMTMTQNHLKRNERNVSTENAILIEQMEYDGIRPMEGFNVMAIAAGGEEHLSHTRLDHINFVQRLRSEKIDGGDAQNVVDRLSELKKEDPNFYDKIRLVNNSRLCALFWRDAMMREDYDLFGDVVIFDTTYNTNKYGIVCAPIVSVNNHWNTVMFGCAFLHNEKAETFSWFLKEFRKSMGGKQPKTIFTHQDFAMSKSIEEGE